MHEHDHVEDTSTIITPALVVFEELVEDNLAKMIAIAGDPSRLRPHCKTHKTREVTRMQLERGIAKQKAATFAEAEMLARTGVTDILLAYNLVGANIARAAKFVQEFPEVTFSVLADHPGPVDALGKALSGAGHSLEVLLDLDVGQHRTGVPVGGRAAEVYQQIAGTPGLEPGGLHVYDGHQHQLTRDERRAAIQPEWEKVLAFRDDLTKRDLPVPRIVAGGTGSFPIYAEKDDPAIELSPGTCVFWDAGYGKKFPDLDFTPAALLLTRVISRPTENRVTCDLGYKAVASDPPMGQRLTLPDLPDAEQVLQNEEHLVLETPRAGEFQPGDELWAIPTHICPTTALHKQLFIVREGRLAGHWDVAARDRWLTV